MPIILLKYYMKVDIYIHWVTKKTRQHTTLCQEKVICGETFWARQAIIIILLLLYKFEAICNKVVDFDCNIQNLLRIKVADV